MFRLPYCVPNLKADLVATVDRDDLGSVLHANGDVVVLGELSLDVAGDEGRLANPCIDCGLP
jgi:hypothetical protein